MRPAFRCGIEILSEERPDLLQGRRVGLLTHPAALTSRGVWSPDLLHQAIGGQLVSLLGPEHGLFGHGGAGEHISSSRHPYWDVPIHSLYGSSRKPTPEMMQEVDVLVVDLQDLAVRCYTFVSTLRLVMEAAADAGKAVIVTDRPVPFRNTVDGPMLDEAYRSFVADVPFPLVYGMTPGEAARYLALQLPEALELEVVPMAGYGRESYRAPDWPPWVPPSTGIRSWESAWCYPSTVYTEALPALSCGRSGPLPFQVLSASWMEGLQVAEELTGLDLPGVSFHPYLGAAPGSGEEGIRLAVTDPDRFQPVTTGLALLDLVQRRYGQDRVWNAEGTREHFFDQLYGTDQTRKWVQAGGPLPELTTGWEAARHDFLELRGRCLLYD